MVCGIANLLGNVYHNMCQYRSQCICGPWCTLYTINLFVKSKAHQLTDLQKMLEQKDSIFKNEKEKLPDTNL